MATSTLTVAVVDGHYAFIVIAVNLLSANSLQCAITGATMFDRSGGGGGREGGGFAECSFEAG